ncbi:hypothetical protein D7V21_05475 [Acinetobacter guerrae]|uniref:Signal peptide containing protein n=1 Tax=Acinetobacter guerrae TaxID=1843371 RepID=A0A3A8EXK8_9GAMM|nr:hypothetical protein [Acinetobacter guerrae]RKG34804.1 hypothetical protein D7V21_05475 [Acinetobacter guerrae]
MKHYWVVLLLTFGLAACNDDNKDQQNTDITQNLAPDLSQGTYSVSLETSNELPMTGKYYSGSDGNRLLIMNNDEDRAAIVMSYDAKSKTWQTNQNSPVPINFAHIDQITDQAVDIGSLAENYILSFPSDQSIQLEITSSGEIHSKEKNCSFAGTITKSQMNNVINYQIQNNTCDVLKNNTKGYLVIDEDLSPASFRLVSSIAGSQDGWAFISGT